MVQGVKSIILNNSYKIYYVKCPGFWFWLTFVPYATGAVFYSMGETLDICLPPWFAISNSALKRKSEKNSNFYGNLIKLYSTQNGCGHVCVPYATWLPVSLWRRVLSRNSLSVIAYVLLNWSIKWKSFGLRQECCMSNY